MKIKAFCIAGAFSLLLGGCAALDDTKGSTGRSGPQTLAAKQRCEANQPECHITVRVQNCKVVGVDPEKAYVKHRKGGAIMVWTIVGSEAVFAPGKGIRFKKPAPITPQRVFRLEKFTPNSQTFRMHNVTEPDGEFPYAINVIESGKACDEYDPSVVNEW